MVIMVCGYRVIEGTNKRLYLVDKRQVAKYDNYHDFGFDIYNPKNWKTFLQAYKTEDGKGLPTKYNDEDVVYHVFMFGVPKGFPRAKPGSSVYNLFPGIKETGDGLNPAVHGHIK